MLDGPLDTTTSPLKPAAPPSALATRTDPLPPAPAPLLTTTDPPSPSSPDPPSISTTPPVLPPPPDTDGLPFSYLAEDGNSPGRQAGRAIGDAAAAELLRLYAPEGGGGAAAALPGGDDALPEEFLATSEPQAAAVHGFVPPIAT